MPINFHSHIITFLIENLGEETTIQEIVEIMKSIGVKARIKGELIIFNYTIGADFSNPVVREARGIIMSMGLPGYITHLTDWNVVCWPFSKFGNYGESYAAKIDWSTATIQQKVDGSILKLFRYKGIWTWATNSTFSAKEANTTIEGRTFMDVIESADNFKDIDYNKLDNTKTYLFELVSPETRVVVDYPFTHLYHIGTRSNLTGLEYNNDIGIEKPKIYEISNPNINKVIEAAESLNHGVCENEGFVVCDSNFNRIKVKNPQYLMLHHNLTRESVSKEDVVEAIILNDEEKILTMLSYPRFKVQFKYWDWQVTKFLYELDLYVKSIRNLYDSLGQDRKAFALKIKDDKFKSFGFMAIDHMECSAKELVINVGIKRILRFIGE